jgi:hypothetical protein
MVARHDRDAYRLIIGLFGMVRDLLCGNFATFNNAKSAVNITVNCSSYKQLQQLVKSPKLFYHQWLRKPMLVKIRRWNCNCCRSGNNTLMDGQP